MDRLTLLFLTIFFHFILRFWYQVFTCSWVSPRDWAKSNLEGMRYRGRMRRKGKGRREGSCWLAPGTAATAWAPLVKPILPPRALLSFQESHGWNSGKLRNRYACPRTVYIGPAKDFWACTAKSFSCPDSPHSDRSNYKSLLTCFSENIPFSSNPFCTEPNWSIRNIIKHMLLTTLPNRNLWKFYLLTSLKKTFN